VTPTVESLFVVEKACKFAPDMSSGTIVIESRNDSQFNLAIEELQHANARNMATAFAAQKGIGDARVNGNLNGPYPINSEGQVLDQVKDPETGAALPPQHPLMQPKAYRVDVPVCRRLV
jgi:hypothetical protein